jgi:site-specific DNA-methyltransferase (adenine-specific)
MTAATVLRGDVLDVLPTLGAGTVDAVVCDPPYALGFMGHTWDTHTPRGFQRWCEAWAAECFRVLRPGGHLLAFGGTRTVHRLTSGIEDAGFEIRDGIDWIHSQGFPKSLNVAEAIDRHRAAAGGDAASTVRAWLNARRLDAGLSLKAVNEALGAASNGGGLASAWMTNPTSKGIPNWAQWCALKASMGFGDEMDDHIRHLHTVAASGDRPVIGARTTGRGTGRGATAFIYDGRTAVTGPATDAARQWEGWGTALKPAREPIVMARKPPTGTVAANVQAHGTGAINIDATRTGGPACRWPTNVIMSHAGDDDTGDACADGCVPGCAVAELDAQSGTLKSGKMAAGTPRGNTGGWAGPMPAATRADTIGDTGGASRFYPVFRYQAKAPTRERPKYWRPACNCETVKPCPDTSQPKGIDASTSEVASHSNTSTSGNSTTENPSPPAMTSIIGTATSSTTPSKISSSSPNSNTSVSTLAVSFETTDGGNPANSATGCTPSTSSTSTSPARDGLSTVDAAGATSESSSSASVCAACGAPWKSESHATVKPLDLMRWLVRLVTPPDGHILDPFAGSGTTVEAALLENVHVTAVEQEPTYLPLIQARIDRARATSTTRPTT